MLLKREGPEFIIKNKTVETQLQCLYHTAGTVRNWAAVRYSSSLLHHNVDSISPFITAVLVHGKQVIDLSSSQFLFEETFISFVCFVVNCWCNWSKGDRLR